MTSKEALNSIADKCAIKEYDKNGNLIKWVGTIDKEYLTIMQDLEILEILKKLAKGVIDLKEKNIDITKYVVLISESTNKKIKEWLNGKNK